MRRPETSHRAHRALAVLSIASATVLTLSPNARADEGGVPFWFSGQYASLAAVPATPGWSLPMQGPSKREKRSRRQSPRRNLAPVNSYFQAA